MLVEAPEGEIIESDDRKFWKEAHQYINFPFTSGASSSPPPPNRDAVMPQSVKCEKIQYWELFFYVLTYK